jgi:hypothetical protein
MPQGEYYELLAELDQFELFRPGAEPALLQFLVADFAPHAAIHQRTAFRAALLLEALHILCTRSQNHDRLPA